MSRKPDRLSRLITTAQYLIGLVVLLGLAAFCTLNPYLITLFAFSQILMVAGIGLFLVALVTRRSVVKERQASQKTPASVSDSAIRIRALLRGRGRVVSDVSGRKYDRGVKPVRDSSRHSK